MEAQPSDRFGFHHGLSSSSRNTIKTENKQPKNLLPEQNTVQMVKNNKTKISRSLIHKAFGAVEFQPGETRAKVFRQNQVDSAK